MSVPNPLPANRCEAIARARAALDAETDPAVVRAWAGLFEEIDFDEAVGSSSDLIQDLRRIELVLLLGAIARA